MLELIFLFVTVIPTVTAQMLTENDLNTIIDRYNLCRKVCTQIVSSRGQIVGTSDKPSQIDETRFPGRRKAARC